MRQIFKLFLFFVMLLSFSAAQSSKYHIKKPDSQSADIKKATTTQFHGILQGFNMQVWMGNLSAMGLGYDGSFTTPNGLGLEYPAGSGIEHLYGAGPWIGALVDTATSGPPRIIKAVTTGYDGCSPPFFEFHGNPDGRDSFYTTSMDFYNGHNLKGFDDDGDDKIDEDELDGVDNDGDGFIDEDYGAVSDHDAYVSYSDMYGDPYPIPGHVPLGIKVWQRSFSWQTDVNDPIIPMEYYFMNVGTRILDSVYIGFFVDADVGLRYIDGYYWHNYSAYLNDVHTAYVNNPVDTPSTPIGFTLLATPKSLDDPSLKYTFQWFPCPPGGPSNDRARYDLMALGQIKQDESPSLTETKFFFSFGPFAEMRPGDTLKIVMAIVSGSGVTQGKNNLHDNAYRAIKIYESGYFIMPDIQVNDGGDGTSARVSWEPVNRSPYGSVTSYRVYYGTSTGQYTDSLVVGAGSTTVTLHGLTTGQTYYIAVAAFDDKNHRSAQDEVMIAPLVIPRTPTGVNAVGLQRTIALRWDPNIELDLAGYNVYRFSSLDTTHEKINPSLLTLPLYTDTDVWGDRTYYYVITARDSSGNESQLSPPVSARLIPPAKPANVLLGPGKNFIRLVWSPNTEPDLKSYNIYRSTDSLTGFAQLNKSPLPVPGFVDSTDTGGILYYYRIQAIDSTDAASDSAEISGHTVLMNQGILVVHSTPTYLGSIFYQWVFNGYPIKITTTLNIYDPRRVFDLGNYSTIVWLQDQFLINLFPGRVPNGIKAYVLGGGHVLVMNRQLYAGSLDWQPFVRDIFGVDTIIYSKLSAFVAATGENGYPSVAMDSLKSHGLQGTVYFPGIPSNRVIYTYKSNSYDSLAEGQPVGLLPVDSSLNIVYMSFPLYYLDSLSAKTLITKVLTGFDEITSVREGNKSLPRSYRLYQAYPNPFNPTTKIRYTLAGRQNVGLRVFNVLGEEVSTLVSETQPPGEYVVEWDANRFASGVYFYQLRAGNFVDAKKVLLLR